MHPLLGHTHTALPLSGEYPNEEGMYLAILTLPTISSDGVTACPSHRMMLRQFDLGDFHAYGQRAGYGHGRPHVKGLWAWTVRKSPFAGLRGKHYAFPIIQQAFRTL